jgi:hypothetical protein
MEADDGQTRATDGRVEGVGDLVRVKAGAILARELSDAARSGNSDRQLAIVRALSEVDLSDKRDQGDLEVQTLADLIAEVDAAPAPRYLLRPVMAEGDYGVFAAEDKSGKTWAGTDLGYRSRAGHPGSGSSRWNRPGPC